MPVNRVDHARPGAVNKVDLSYEAAQQVIARAVSKTITRSAHTAKTFGDKGQVSRWCRGENPNLAKLWQREDVRHELVIALAEAAGMEVEVTLRVRRA